MGVMIVTFRLIQKIHCKLFLQKIEGYRIITWKKRILVYLIYLEQGNFTRLTFVIFGFMHC